MIRVGLNFSDVEQITLSSVRVKGEEPLQPRALPIFTSSVQTKEIFLEPAPVLTRHQYIVFILT